jgi:site-specific recombinase XerD
VIDQYALAARDRGHSPATVRRRTLTCRRFQAWLQTTAPGGPKVLLEAEDIDVERWLGSLAVAPHSKGQYAGDLDAFYRWAVRWRHLEQNPLADLERPKRPKRKPRPVGSSDLEVAIAAAEDRRLKTILILCAFAGLRIHEVTGLDGTDIDRDRGVLVVRGKGDKERTVPMHPLVAGVLEGHRHGPVIRSTIDGRAITADYAGKLVSRHMRRLGIRATAHKLRHYFGTETYRICSDLRVVQELLGHADPTTTAGYVAASEQRAHEAVAGLALGA